MKNLRTNSALFGSIQAKDSNGLHLQDDGGNGIFIKDGGDVGIGTTNPSRKLHVEDSHIRVNNDYGLESDGGSSRVVVGNAIISLETSLTEAVRINSNGQVGIGTTSPSATLSVAGNVFVADSTSNAFAPNVIVTGATADVMRIGFDSGGARSNILSGRDSTTSSSTESYLGFETRKDTGAMDEAMRIDSAGNVGIGTTNPQDILHVSPQGVTNSNFRVSGGNGLIHLKAVDDASTANVDLAMGPAGNTIYIKNDGNVGIGTTSPSATLSVDTGDNDFVTKFKNIRSSIAYGISNSLNNANDSTSGGEHLRCATGGAVRLKIYANGNVQNTHNSYGQLSDIKLKENVADATPKLDDLNKVRVVNFNFKGDELKQIGVVAQELEEIFPGLVDDVPDYDEDNNLLEATTKSVKYSVFVPILIKAIQEQQQIIEDLKSQNESLAARITALEG
jgi:hypothetical protein